MVQKTKMLSEKYVVDLPVVDEDDERFCRNVKNCGLTGLLLGLSVSTPSILRYELPTGIETALSIGLAYAGMVLSLAFCTRNDDVIRIGEYSLGPPLLGTPKCDYVKDDCLPQTK